MSIRHERFKPLTSMFNEFYATGPPATPYNIIQSSNTMDTATIRWSSMENDITYTVTSTSLMSPSVGILQESFILRDLEKETNYTVSVTATNECGDESQPSKNVTVRIDVPGMYVQCSRFCM